MTDPIVRKRVRLAQAFRAEIKCWKLSMEEEAIVRSLMACVAIRMQGKDPMDELNLKP